MGNDLEEQFDQIHKSLNTLFSLLEQFQSDEILTNRDQCWFYTSCNSAESFELSDIFQYLVQRIKRVGFKEVQYYLFLENPVLIQQRHKLLLFILLRRICIQALGDIYASKVVIELTEDTDFLLVEIAYHEVASTILNEVEDSLLNVEAYISSESGEMTIGNSGNILFINIALPI